MCIDMHLIVNEKVLVRHIHGQMSPLHISLYNLCNVPVCQCCRAIFVIDLGTNGDVACDCFRGRVVRPTTYRIVKVPTTTNS